MRAVPRLKKAFSAHFNSLPEKRKQVYICVFNKDNKTSHISWQQRDIWTYPPSHTQNFHELCLFPSPLWENNFTLFLGQLVCLNHRVHSLHYHCFFMRHVHVPCPNLSSHLLNPSSFVHNLRSWTLVPQKPSNRWQSFWTTFRSTP